MLKVIVSLLVLVLAISQPVDIKAKIDHIHQNRIGKTLLDTVYLQLQTQEPIERLVGTLQLLEDRYHSDQKEDDHSHQEFQDACTADLNEIDSDIKVSDDERIALEAKLEGELYPRKEIIQKLINQKSAELRSLTSELDELDAQRAEEAAEFSHKMVEHDEVAEILFQTKQLFTQNLQTDSGESAFVQYRNQMILKPTKLSLNGVELLQKHFSTSMKRATKFSHRKSWGKLFKTLATITTRVEALADQNSIAGIIELIDQLQERVSESKAMERFAEDKRIEAYNKVRNLLTISITVTESALSNATTEMAIVNEHIEQTTATLDNTRQRLEILIEKRADRFNTCELEAKDYQDSRAKRDEDRNVVSETLGLLNLHLRELREQLALRLQAGDTVEF